MSKRVDSKRYVYLPWPKSVDEPDADGGVVWMVKQALIDNSSSAMPDAKRRFGVGKFWSVFASETDDWSVVKVQPLTSEARLRRAVKEERIYRIAAEHGVGPAVRSWFTLSGSEQMPDKKAAHASSGWLSPKSCTDRKVWATAVAVVERFDESVLDAGIEDDRRYLEALDDLKKRVERMEDKTGIVNVEPFQPRNVLVEWKRPECVHISRLVVGDWGSYRE